MTAQNASNPQNTPNTPLKPRYSYNRDASTGLDEYPTFLIPSRIDIFLWCFPRSLDFCIIVKVVTLTVVSATP